jgi:hypothetical protein
MRATASRSALCTTALSVSLLVACTNSGTRPVPPDAVGYDAAQVAALSSAHDAQDASKALIYVSTSGGIVVFDQNGNGPVEQIPNDQGVLQVDASGNLYVSSGREIGVYAPGKTTRLRTIHLSNSIDNFHLDTRGNIWGTIVCNPTCHQAALFEFNTRGKLLQALSCSALQLYYGLTVDAAGDAFVDGYPRSGPTTVVEWPVGTTTCQVLQTSEQGSGQLQFTEAGNLVVDDDYQARSITYAHPKFDKIIATTHFSHVGFNFYTGLRKANQQIWVSSSDFSTVARYPYPAGGTATLTIDASRLPGYPGSIAVSPCSEPSC